MYSLWIDCMVFVCLICVLSCMMRWWILFVYCLSVVRLVMQVVLMLIDLCFWLVCIGCLLILCDSWYNCCLNVLNLWCRLISGQLCNCVQVWMLSWLSCVVVILLMLCSLCIGSVVMNVLILCGCMMNSLLGLFQLDVIFVMNLFGVMFVDMVMLIVLCICLWILCVISVVLFW